MFQSAPSTGIFVIPEAPAPAWALQPKQPNKKSTEIRLGILDNSKGNADHLLEMLVERVLSEVPISSVVRLRKPTAGLPAPAELLDQLVREVDCVVTAMAD